MQNRIQAIIKSWTTQFTEKRSCHIADKGAYKFIVSDDIWTKIYQILKYISDQDTIIGTNVIKTLLALQYTWVYDGLDNTHTW